MKSTTIFISGLLLGLIIVAAISGISSSGKECYPMSSGRNQSFHFLEIENCFETNKDTCWIEENQYEKFKITFNDRYYAGTKFDNGKMLFLMNSQSTGSGNTGHSQNTRETSSD